MKVSFDFDETLTFRSVQNFAKSLIEEGREVWIVTSRLETKKAPSNSWNKDLESVADFLGIDNIEYCGYEPKWKFFLYSNFIAHLDDDKEEVDKINEETETKAVHYDLSKNLSSLEKFKEIL